LLDGGREASQEMRDQPRPRSSQSCWTAIAVQSKWPSSPNSCFWTQDFLEHWVPGFLAGAASKTFLQGNTCKCERTALALAGATVNSTSCACSILPNLHVGLHNSSVWNCLSTNTQYLSFTN
jgi:hypothetical protein